MSTSAAIASRLSHLLRLARATPAEDRRVMHRKRGKERVMQGIWNYQYVRRLRLTLALLLVAGMGTIGSMPAYATTITFQQVNLVSNIPGLALTTDPNLV